MKEFYEKDLLRGTLPIPIEIRYLGMKVQKKRSIANEMNDKINIRKFLFSHYTIALHSAL